jgi:hypothetical protein
MIQDIDGNFLYDYPSFYPRELVDFYAAKGSICRQDKTIIVDVSAYQKKWTSTLRLKEDKVLKTGLENARIYVYVNNDGAKLIADYKKICNPADDEIYVFVENNDKDIVSDAVLLIKCGRDITKILAGEGKDKAKLQSVLTAYLNTDYKLSSSQITQLLNQIAQNPQNLITQLLGTLKQVNTEIAKVVSKTIAGLTTKLLKKCITYIETNYRYGDPKWDTATGDQYDPAYLIKRKKNTQATSPKDIVAQVEMADMTIVATVKTAHEAVATITEMLIGCDKFIIGALSTALQGASLADARQVNALYQPLGDAIYKFIKLLDDNMAHLEALIVESCVLANAFLCGLTNGLVDQITGLLSLIRVLIEAMAAAVDPLDRKQVEESIDNIIQAMIGFDFMGLLVQMLPRLVQLCELTSGWLSRTIAGVSSCQIAYYLGYIVFCLLELLIPYGAVVEGLVDTTAIGGRLSVFLDKFKAVFQQLSQLMLPAIRLPKTDIKPLLHLLDEIVERIHKGIEPILAWIDEVLVKLDKYLKAQVKELIDKFSKDGEAEELLRKIERKINLNGQEVLAIQEIKALRRELADGFKVGLEIVEDNPDLKKKLKDWNIRKVAASFNAIEGKLYIRKLTTAYTVEHEMIHMKLWYKMTREHPEMAGLYKLTSGNKLFHEEYVLAQFMKNPSKWSEADLINDLDGVNEIRDKRKLDKVTLDYFKTWDFKEELNKITQ